MNELSSIDLDIQNYNQADLLLVAFDSCEEQKSKLIKTWIHDYGSQSAAIKWVGVNYGDDPRVEIVLCVASGLSGVFRKSPVLIPTAELMESPDAKIDRQKDKIEHAISSSFRHLIETNWVDKSSLLIKSRLIPDVTDHANSTRMCADEDYATWLRTAAVTDLKGLKKTLTYYRVAEKTIQIILQFILFSISFFSYKLVTGKKLTNNKIVGKKMRMKVTKYAN